MTTLGATVANIYEKIAKVMADVSSVPKTGYNQHGNYKYATDADIVGAVHGAMAAHSITMHVVSAVVMNERDVPTKHGGLSHHAMFMFTFRFACGYGEGEYLDVQIPSEAMDTSDKAYYKAITGAKKYALLTTFCLETEDDPERDDIEAGNKAHEPPRRQPPPKPNTARPAGQESVSPRPKPPVVTETTYTVKLNEAQIEAIRDRLAPAGMTEEDFCQKFGVLMLDEVPAKKYKNILGRLDALAAERDAVHGYDDMPDEDVF